MKNFISLMLIIAVIAMSTDLCLAARRRTRGRTILTEAQKQTLRLKTISILNSQKWAIALRPTKIKKGIRAQADVLTFTDGTVTSAILSARGYKTSNYAVNIKDDGTPVFETVQRDAEGNIAILRGEIRGNTITGAIHIRYKKGGGEIYRF